MENKPVVKQTTALVKYTKEQFLKDFAPRACMVKLANVGSIEKAVKTGLNSLASLVRIYDREFIINYLQLWIIDLNEFLNLSTKMNKEQIKDTAELIFINNSSLNIADINIVFTEAKKGSYGQFYGSLDGSKLLQWFRDYFLNRQQWYYENISLHEHEGIQKHGYLKWQALNKTPMEIKKQE